MPDRRRATGWPRPGAGRGARLALRPEPASTAARPAVGARPA